MCVLDAFRKGPFGVTSGERELGSGEGWARDAETERMESAGREGHLKASNK